MIRGELVIVRLRRFGETDRYGNPKEGYSEPIEVDNVLVGKASTVSIDNEGQPYAIEADRRFCFPRWWTEDLRGALITRKGKTYQVVGDPAPLTEENLPNLPWNTYAETVRYDG